MTRRFLVGDKVRIISAAYEDVKVGELGTVISRYASIITVKLFDGVEYSFKPEYLTLVKKPKVRSLRK